MTAKLRVSNAPAGVWEVMAHHGRDVTQALQILHDAALVRGLHPGEAAHRLAGLPLQPVRQLVELAARQAAAEAAALPLLLLLCDDAHPPAD